MTIESHLTLFDTSLQLLQYPEKSQHVSWRAWDAADEYLIQHVVENVPHENQQQMIILNDDFGALTCWFADVQVQSVSDSFVAQRACQRNLQRNTLTSEGIRFLTSLDTPSEAPLVLIKLPKSLALLEHQLIQLQSIVNEGTTIIAAGMVKHMAKSVFSLMEKYLGAVTTSLAKKKARLLFCQPTGNKHHTSPFPTQWKMDNSPFTISNHANVFSREQLDIGARVLLDALPNLTNETVVDLGCGNGVLGLTLLNKYPDCRVTFVDESYMAVASAKQNVSDNLPAAIERCEFVVSNCLEKVNIPRLDLVLCNPPFHQQATITDHIAWQMFTDSHKALRKGGELRIVGNRHLDYPAKLKRLFGGYQVVHSTRKFSVLQTFKR